MIFITFRNFIVREGFCFAFHHVSFSYDKTKPILENLSFQVKPGEVIALVGEIGAGKTTIVNLLTRFYDADSGEIRIVGCFSVVLQDTSLFSGRIMDNIRYSKDDATEEDVIKAAKTARAHDFIAKLPQGYGRRKSLGKTV